MAMMLLVSGLLLTVPAIYGRSLPEKDLCQIVITKDGHKIINGSAAVAFTGRLNQVLCSLKCPGIHIPPALTWFKGDREEQGGKKIPEAIRRVATSTTAAKRISWLNIWNMKDSDMGRYTCVGYKDGYGMVWASLDLEYVCRGSMFMCDVSKCVPKEKACDGVSDCFDGIDERQCPPECDEGNEFLCDNKCLPRSYRCNGMVDCEGGHDEENCTSTILPTTTTTPTTTPTSTTSTSTTESTACSNEDFKCNNDTCIPKANFCNGEPDCEDGEDELNCTTTVDYSTTAAPTTPATTTTTATPSTTAAPTTPATPTTTATPTTVTTTTSTVITTTSAEATTINDLFWALAIVNTNNEVLVTNGNETTLTIEEDDVSTGLTLSCQSFGDVEDPQLNWQIGSNVLTSTSTSHTLKVNLIPEHLQSGEAVACLARETTSGRMINASVGFIINRTQGCKGNQFKCNDGSCIDNSSVNNGFPDCDNGEDETATRTCLEGQILCSDKSHCIASSDVCDGKDDCNDHGDEVNCPPNKEQTEAISNV